MIKKHMPAHDSYHGKVASYILDSILEAVIVTDLKLRIIGWNKGATQTYGWQTSEVVGKKVNKVLASDTSPEDIKKIISLLKKQGYWKGNVVQRRRDGSQIHISASVSVVKNASGRPVHYIAVNHDNTEQKNILERLHYMSEVGKLLSSSHNVKASLRKIAKLAIPRMADWCSIDLLNEDGTIELAAISNSNPAILKIGKRIRGVLLSGVIGDIGLLEVLKSGKPVFRSTIQKDQLKKRARTDKFYSVLQMIRPNSIMIIPLIIRSKTIGAITFCLAGKTRFYTSTDLQHGEQIASLISQAVENVRLYKTLENERNRLSTLLSTVPGIVFEIWGVPDEKNQRANFVSKYVEKMLGYSVKQWLEVPNFWRTIVHPDDYERVKNESLAYYTQGKSGILKYRWITKKGKVLWVKTRLILIKDKAGNSIGMRGVTMDISDLVRKGRITAS